MQILATKLYSLQIMSLQTAEMVGIVEQPVMDADRLEIVALKCLGRGNRHLVLPTKDIRQLAVDCILVNSEEELSEPEDLVRLKPALEASIQLIGSRVETEMGRPLGKVEDYTFEPEEYKVIKLHVSQSILR